MFLMPFILLLISCEESEPTKFSETKAIAIEKIDSIYYSESFIVVKATYILPNSCWAYQKTEITGNDSIVKIILYAKSDGQNCPDVLSYLSHSDTIYFNKAGFKKLSFWRSDSSYKDTTIIFAAHYNINFPEFFIEKGSDSDSSYISFRGRKIHPYLFEIEGTGWVKSWAAIFLHLEPKPQAIHVMMMADCGVGVPNIWDKETVSEVITADILDTVNTLVFKNFQKNTDTILVRR
jgi:hypothetical protein